MRSHTPDDLPGRCPRCWVMLAYCVCGVLPRVNNATEILIVRHELEARKSSGTARIAELVLSRVQVLPHTVSFSEPDSPSLEGAWLLYPGCSTSSSQGPPPKRLVLLDGTWAQARHMRGRMPHLTRLPWLSLPPKAESPVRLRSSPNAASRSTLEAIADALEILEGKAISDPLHRAHEIFVYQVLKARGSVRLQL